MKITIERKEGRIKKSNFWGLILSNWLLPGKKGFLLYVTITFTPHEMDIIKQTNLMQYNLCTLPWKPYFGETQEDWTRFASDQIRVARLVGIHNRKSREVVAQSDNLPELLHLEQELRQGLEALAGLIARGEDGTESKETFEL